MVLLSTAGWHNQGVARGRSGDRRSCGSRVRKHRWQRCRNPGVTASDSRAPTASSSTQVRADRPDTARPVGSRRRPLAARQGHVGRRPISSSKTSQPRKGSRHSQSQPAGTSHATNTPQRPPPFITRHPHADGEFGWCRHGSEPEVNTRARRHRGEMQKIERRWFLSDDRGRVVIDYGAESEPPNRQSHELPGRP